MIYKRSTGELFTSKGVLIKRLHCPKGGMGSVALARSPNGGIACSGCSRSILDVTKFDEDKIIAAVAKDAGVCFMLDLGRCRIVI
jgi:hypothetical protein